MPGRLTPPQTARVRELVLNHLQESDSITNREVRQLAGISYDEATNFLIDMVKAGVLTRVGTGAGTYYVETSGAE